MGLCSPHPLCRRSERQQTWPLTSSAVLRRQKIPAGGPTALALGLTRKRVSAEILGVRGSFKLKNPSPALLGSAPDGSYFFGSRSRYHSIGSSRVKPFSRRWFFTLDMLLV